MSGAVQVSVVMPTYNGAQHLDEAIRSVLAQRGVPFELLIGDDASTDGTWDRIRPYLPDPRVRVWRFHDRLGPGGNRNRLAVKARGRHLSICDQDDGMLPGNLKRLSRALDRWPRVGVVNGLREILNARGEVSEDPAPLSKHGMGWDLLRMQIHHHGSMIRKSVFQRAGGYDSSIPFGLEDLELFLRLGEITRMRVVEGPPVYQYRVHNGSLYRRSGKKQAPILKQILRKTILRRHGVRVPW